LQLALKTISKITLTISRKQAFGQHWNRLQTHPHSHLKTHWFTGHICIHGKLKKTPMHIFG